MPALFLLFAAAAAILLVLLLAWSDRDSDLLDLQLRSEEGRFRGRAFRFGKNGRQCTFEGGPSFLVLQTRNVVSFGESVTVGDADFNHMFHVQGPRAEVIALLDEGLRARLLRTFRDSTVLMFQGRTRVECSDRSKLENVLRDVAILLDDLEAAAAREPLARLGDRAVHDGMPGVRIAAILELQNRFPESAEFADALKAARFDVDGDLRRLAGAQEGETRARGVDHRGGDQSRSCGSGRALDLAEKQIAAVLP